MLKSRRQCRVLALATVRRFGLRWRSVAADAERAVERIVLAAGREGFRIYATEYRVVTGESAEHLPAMKLEARLAENAPKIATLVRMLRLRSPEEGAAIHHRLPPTASVGGLPTDGGRRALTSIPRGGAV